MPTLCDQSIIKETRTLILLFSVTQAPTPPPLARLPTFFISRCQICGGVQKLPIAYSSLSLSFFSFFLSFIDVSPFFHFSIFPFLKGEKIDAIKVILNQHISGRNLTVLRILFFFIAEVGAHHEKNGMTCANLAIVFGPNLIWAKGAGPDSGKIPQLSHLKYVSLRYIATHRTEYKYRSLV